MTITHPDSAPMHPLAAALATSESAADVLTAAGHADAAAAVNAGRPLAEVLDRDGLVPRAYLAAFDAGTPAATRALVAAAARHERRYARVRRVARAALASAASAWVVMIAASTWAVPAYLAQFADCPGALPGVVRVGIDVFGVLASPAGMICAAVLLLGCWIAARPIWIRTPSGRRSEDAFSAAALATQTEAGVGVPQALRRVARATHRSGRFIAAADALERGSPMSAALAQAGIIAADQGGLVDRSGAALPGVLRSIAAIREAEQSASAPHAGQWIWALYALIVGATAAVFAGLIMGGSVAVMQCVG